MIVGAMLSTTCTDQVQTLVLPAPSVTVSANWCVPGPSNSSIPASAMKAEVANTNGEVLSTIAPPGNTVICVLLSSAALQLSV
ncbi:MAG: hypothetical protein GFGODING_01267 [Flavobacteriales bacterium]|nr:hypothetical protein [Flavobacteriales bacterium]